MSYLTSVKTINGETSGFYEYPIKYVATSAEATDNSTLYVLTGNSYGEVVPTLFFKPINPYNPLGLPDYTIRVKYISGFTPRGELSMTLIDAENNVWDITYDYHNWNYLFKYSDMGGENLIEVLGANTTHITNMEEMFNGCTNLTSVSLFDTSNVTNMNSMFRGCSSLTSVPLFDTSSVTNLGSMFRGCSSLTSVPLFDTSSVTNLWYTFGECSSLTSVPLFDTSSVTSMGYMFYQCTNVESGALALYQQASSQTTPPTDHAYTFKNCGSNTTTGAAELAQIPSSWGGTGA